jgi:NAD(P)-dependent dehydrogenase (short-subunit alcohol dehydrogenase family)
MNFRRIDNSSTWEDKIKKYKIAKRSRPRRHHRHQFNFYRRSPYILQPQDRPLYIRPSALIFAPITLTKQYYHNSASNFAMTDHFEKARAEKWDFNIIPSLEGKTAIVTGAYSPDSLGWHIAHQLALKGAKVFIGARSLEKSASGIAAILTTSPHVLADNLKPLVMDLGNFKQVKHVAEEFVKTEPRLDILVNNAGFLPGNLEFDNHGINKSMAVNHLGPFLFTTTLLPLLTKASHDNPDVRIVNVGSTAHFDAPKTAKYASLEDWNQTFGSADEPMANYFRYGYSKLANNLFTSELQRRVLSAPSSIAKSSILVMTVHPGGVATNGAAKFLGGRDNETFRTSFTPFEGAISPLYAAAHPEPREKVEKYQGAFLLPWGGLKEPSALARDESLQKELWSTSEKILEDVLKD